MRDIDAIIDRLRLAYPDISADQLAVLHPGIDDDGLWFFRHPESDVEFQLESSTGACPFLAESSTSAERLTADTIEQAVALVVAGLGFTGRRPNNPFKPNLLRKSA
ncbi:hypothetical protein [Pseudoxanthomonas dokdonensis]|uniref:Uncharacterized protein n=1 Tax=Pseudoxanthomonas dokdonensis TaxID=344882 RepID=A0A0R0CH30_9GAMM|nr:hypothetical protein [Pseudoxanthomonas dokdonensis]KRG68406.1 hypothetical protein ABB29_12905 [Pseudoxanthomonas dokdonensis]